MKEMIVDTELGMIDFLLLVRDLAEGYFGEDGEYQPQFGMLNVMRQFYNYCIKDGELKKEYGDSIVDATEMIEIVKDFEFITAFNDAIARIKPINGDNRLGRSIDFDFPNAFETAIDIVETKKTSFSYIVEGIKKMVIKVLSTLEDVLSEENIAQISEIVGKVDNAGDFATAMIDAYGKSQRFQDVISSGKKEEVTDG